MVPGTHLKTWILLVCNKAFAIGILVCLREQEHAVCVGIDVFDVVF